MFAIHRVRNSAGNSAHPSCTSLPAQWPVPSRTPQGPKAVQDMQVLKPKYNNIIPSSSKHHSSMPISIAKVTPDRVKQLKRDLTNSYDGDILFHHVWKDDIDTSQQQQLQQKALIWDDK